ncbi:cullin-2-like isoform X2 [Oppia nitens]|uniref:cullin-2-like isoform X2 n=1 Tax=Oppia nitens TaxID=1686743 RepID=UPI0023DAD47D|nr:cullin-2-like isoform X2 [Oppia nitens]
MSLKPKHVEFESTWSQIRSTVEKVIVLKHVQRSEWNDRFPDLYQLCVAFPEPLGDRVYNETKAFLDQHVKQLYDTVVKSSHEELLSAYHQQWLIYREGVTYLNILYMYLNTQHIKKHKYTEADLSYGCVDASEQMLEIGELGLHLWRVNMIEPLKESLVQLLLEAIENDRMGIPQNKSVVQGVILSLVHVEEYKKKGSLDLYQNLFESRFLRSTGEYYRREAEELLQSCYCSTYMEKVLAKLDAENLRSRSFLHSSSYPRVTAECESRMVGDHLSFLQSECRSMVQNEARRDLQNMYRLLKPIDSGLQALISEIQEHITNKGLESISSINSLSSDKTPRDDNIPQLFVENLLQVHKQHLNLIKEVFNGDQSFIGALDKACAAVINHRLNLKLPCRSPELLARYCDGLLKKSVKGNTESEIDDKLSACITIFKYIDDKDVFQKFYSKMLAKRLIHSQSVSMDAEESMINKLKQACGYEFTSKLHRMFTDIKVSDDLNNNFNDYVRNNRIELGINFNIYVLQAGAWPLNQSALSPFAIPQALEKSVSSFEKFYASKFNGRKLTWLHHLCQCEIKFGFTKRAYSVVMGTYHMAVLLLFESTDQLTYHELQENTKLTDEQLQRHLQSLIDHKILLVDGNTSSKSNESTDEELSNTATSSTFPTQSQQSPETVYTLNLNYSNKRMKFKITAVQQKEVQQQQEVEQTHASVDEDRKLYLQAAIVRIMKDRKVLKHNQLIEQVINQSKNRFTPSVQMIKKCIEALMEKQYLERNTSNTDEYSYIA